MRVRLVDPQTLPNTVDSPVRRRSNLKGSQVQPRADRVLVAVVAVGGIHLGVGGGAGLGLGHADDHHDLVVRADEVAVEALDDRVVEPAAVVEVGILVGRVVVALAGDGVIVWGAALAGVGCQNVDERLGSRVINP